LFTGDGHYWVPLTRGQPNPHDHASLFHENAILRDVRIRRLEEAHAWSQQPPTRAVRLIGNIMIETAEADEIVVRSAFQLTEWRKARDVRLVSGHYRHNLVRTGSTFGIRLKRVDLVNCDGIHDPFELFL